MPFQKGNKIRLGMKSSEEHKRKISEALKGRPNSKISEALRGRQFSEEHKRSLSMALKGKPSNFKGKHHSEEAKRKIKIARKGKKQTEETIKKRVLMLRGKKRSEEQKRNISESKKGKKRSEETKKKIKETTKKTWNTPEMKEQARLRRLKQKFPKRETSIERKTKEWLDRKGINYIQQFNLGDKFLCDFYIPALNLIVECDGTYWHSREDMKKRDKAKDAYAKKCGFNIIRLSEEQINQCRFF